MIISQNVGIDGGLKDFKVCLMILHQDQSLKVKGTRTFTNNLKGFEAFFCWAEKKKEQTDPLRFTMEATGVYYEQLAYFLHRKAQHVSVILPNKTKAYFQTLNLKSKTDKLEARALAQLGLERKFAKWEPLSKQMYELKTLCRERVMLLEEKTMVSNRLHAETHCQSPNSSVVKRLKKRIDFIKRQIKEVEKQLKTIVKKDKELDKRMDNICQLKGLSFITVITVISETNGFALFRNRAQLTSFSGYDIVQRQSGSSVLGKTKISKKGNRYIRRALHMPSLCVIKYNEEYRNLYERVFERTKIKMKGIVAVQRKLLLLIFSLFKKNQAYDPDFSKQKTAKNCRQDTIPAYAG